MVEQTNSPLKSGSTFRSALRELLARAPQAELLSERGMPLELSVGDAEPPRLKDAQAVEAATAPRHVGGPFSAFAGFLDGAQDSRPVAYLERRPVVAGRVSAAIRERVDRQLRTWRAPLVRDCVFVPFAFLPRAIFAQCFPEDSLVDTTEPDENGEVPESHPLMLLERARHAVQREREQLERELAAQWCREENRPLFIDGGISGSEAVATSSCAVGVVKSHRTLYAVGDALELVLSLQAGERSPVFTIVPRIRSRVYSWYLRLREPAGRGALWGLVRIEVAVSDGVPTARADEVSRWVLAEASPLALPDARWDTMSYGIRNTEMFLRSL
jgi:hypothetical protein